MSSRVLADIELARAKLLDRQTRNENAWIKFNANPVVPKAKQQEKVSIEDWTVFITNQYVGLKEEIAIALDKLRVEEARLRSLLAAEPVTVEQPGGYEDLGFGLLDKQPSFKNGGHKSARRVKSRSKSRTRHKCRSRTKSKSRG
jgi:hypothetical protein